MAITYGAKLFESYSLVRSVSSTIGSTVKAGSLICIALAGKRTGAYLDVASITDSAGNTWQWDMAQSEYRACGVAWTRTKSVMPIGAQILVTWNGTPSYAWKSAHTFEGASGDATEQKHGFGTSSTASIGLNVAGSDWLAFGVIMAPYADAPTLTPLNSGVSRDDNATTSRPWAECLSYNGTTGVGYGMGASGVTGGSWAIAGVSFPYEGLAASAATRSFAFLGGV
jgi:hypothetical protein